jgi:hypothetical protein
MLKNTKTIPLDYALCTMTATVYHREGLTRRVLEGVYLEYADTLSVSGGMACRDRSLLLVIPGFDPIAPGDKVLPGIGPEVTCWEELTTGPVTSVKPRYFRGELCHMEVRA